MNNLTYQSLKPNSLNDHHMTPINRLYNEPKQETDKYACLHCGKDLTTKQKQQKQMVLNRGIYADYLEPEYYRYNKSIKINLDDDLGRKYLEYKPRRPKCPIKFNKLFPENNPSHLIKNPLYEKPISQTIQNIEKQWMGPFEQKNKDFVKNFIDMMDEYDNYYVY
jgi:hypothetical protein